MTQTPLRLVVDRGAEPASSAVGLYPPTAGALHIHLHVGSQSASAAPDNAMPPDTRPKGPQANGIRRPLLLGATAVLIALVAFDFGARTGAGHAQALAAANATAGGASALSTESPTQQATGAVGVLPPALQQQLAQRPTISLPAGAGAQSGGPDLFGLQH